MFIEPGRRGQMAESKTLNPIISDIARPDMDLESILDAPWIQNRIFHRSATIYKHEAEHWLESIQKICFFAEFDSRIFPKIKKKCLWTVRFGLWTPGRDPTQAKPVSASYKINLRSMKIMHLT